MARRYDSEGAKRRILSACVRLFIEKGYRKTKMTDILSAADVSSGTFQNIFHTKDGVLMELVEFMFENQFELAGGLAEKFTNPVMLYGIETALQPTLAELNENLREIYLEAYTQPNTAEYIYRKMATKLYNIFSPYFPDYSESDFYELEIGSAGIMRGYMSRPCDVYFTLERKLARFLKISMNAYNVPEERQQYAISYVLGLDIRKIADQVMQKLFAALAMKFDFSLSKTDS